MWAITSPQNPFENSRKNQNKIVKILTKIPTIKEHTN